MYRLHGFCQSGNAFKVAFALRAMKLPHETVEVDFFNLASPESVGSPVKNDHPEGARECLRVRAAAKVVARPG